MARAAGLGYLESSVDTFETLPPQSLKMLETSLITLNPKTVTIIIRQVR